MSNSILSIDHVTVRYGGVVAVNDVSLEIEENSFVGLIGPNGAGKTTLIDAVCGFCPSEGKVTFDGRRIDRLPAFKRARAGVARTFQAGELFDDLSVIDNILVGSYRGKLSGAFKEIALVRSTAPSERVLEIIDMFGLSDKLDTVIQDMPVGLRKLVAVARALASAPKVLLLDEPAAGLDQTESKNLGETLRKLTDYGTTVILVDHDVDLVLGICDIVHVLETGQVIASGKGAEIRTDPRVMEAYLGTTDVEHAV